MPRARTSSGPMALSLILCPPRGPRSPHRGRAALSETAQSLDGSMRGAQPSGALWPMDGVSLPLPVSSAELLPHLGGLQLQGHKAAFPAEVRLWRASQLGRGRAEGRIPHHRPSHCPSPQDHCAGCCGLLGCLPESGRHGHQHPRWGGGVAGGWGGSRLGLEAGKAEWSRSGARPRIWTSSSAS